MSRARSSVCRSMARRRRAVGRPGRLRSGLTLLEVVVAMFVLAVLIASIFTVLGRGVDTVESFRDRTRVAQIMQNRVETLRGYRWSSFSSEVGKRTLFYDPEKVAITEVPTQPPYGWESFRMEEIIQARSGKPGQFELTLTAFWTPPGRSEQSDVFVTYFYEDGLNKFYTRSMD